MSASIDDTLICRLVGELWATFAPWRGPWDGGGAAAAYLARRSFRSGAGLRWRHSGRDRDERDEIVEALGRLERRGLLHRQVEKTKVVAVRLHDAGVERACALVGAPCWHAGWRVCRRLDDEWETMTHLGTRWVAEWVLAGTPPNWAVRGVPANPQRLAALEESAVPALVRGWLLSGADIHGRAWYSLTDSGRAALTEASPEDASGIIADADCVEAWREGAHAMQVRLAAAPRSEREIGLLPLPVHGGPCVGRDVGPRGDVPTAGAQRDGYTAHLATVAQPGRPRGRRGGARPVPWSQKSGCGGWEPSPYHAQVFPQVRPRGGRLPGRAILVRQAGFRPFGPAQIDGESRPNHMVLHDRREGPGDGD